MILAPIPLGNRRLAPEALSSDLNTCQKIGPCGLGREAIYIGGRFWARRYYLPWREVKRVFKRVAMSRGGFSGRGLFGSMAYVVVQYGGGKETQCRFKNEADADRLLAQIGRDHPTIPLHSAQAEKKLAAAAAAEEARYLKELTPEAEASVASLRRDVSFLNERASQWERLAAAAKQKRIVDQMSPAFRVGGAMLGVLGILAAVYGLYGLIVHRPLALYFLIGGGAVFFLTLSTNTFPSRWNSPRAAQAEWDGALKAMRGCLGDRAFPVPVQYAHPIVLERMIRVLREGRAQTTAEALEAMKEDLRALNASVTVSQKEHDEVVAVKPLFLVCGYENEI